MRPIVPVPYRFRREGEPPCLWVTRGVTFLNGVTPRFKAVRLKRRHCAGGASVEPGRKSFWDCSSVVSEGFSPGERIWPWVVSDLNFSTSVAVRDRGRSRLHSAL